ncbi:hypothetical protein [Sphingobium sp. EM0848]|uniref:hypothetical protein n=1 Tax=Sphingobium sp. EM0848 TaxID=2743473 RepID=UPI00159C18DA|nr:hypothetical protein [Sphingobium sp. EM0848]
MTATIATYESRHALPLVEKRLVKWWLNEHDRPDCWIDDGAAYLPAFNALAGR